VIAKLKRRDFITLLGGAAAAWPLVARGQEAGRIYRGTSSERASMVGLAGSTAGVQ
jgi:hypothetical protein